MKIALDFGHGGKDPGAVDDYGDDKLYPDYYYTEESELVRRIGLRLASRLLDRYDVLLTRPNDDYVELEDRAVMANRYEADLFISLHTNASANTRANGVEMFHYPGSDEGLRLSKELNLRLVERCKVNNRGIKTKEDLIVLKYTSMPAVLLELGFITNPIEEEKLHNNRYQTQLIEGIYEGVQRYEQN